MITKMREESVTPATTSLSVQILSTVGRVFQVRKKSAAIKINQENRVSKTSFGQEEFRNRKGMIMSTTPVMTTPLDELPVYSLKEVSLHDSLDDCWVIIYDRIYDVTTFITEHPGGDDVMLEHAGRDATLAFRSVGHSKSAEIALEPYLIGALPSKEQIWSRLVTTAAQNR